MGLAKNKSELQIMRDGGKILAQIIHDLGKEIEAGLTTLDLDRIAADMCQKHNVKPAFLGYMNYPNSLCVAVNDEVVHGVPNDRVIKEGDIVSIDLGIIYEGLITDHAITVAVGDIAENAKKIMTVTEQSMYAGIKQAVAGNTTGDIGHAMQKVSEDAGFNMARDLIGHGVGYKVHEEPQVPGYGRPGTGDKLEEGMTLAIEAIVLEGDWEIEFDKHDGWTTRSKDGKLACLFEHTVIVGKDKPEILTKLN